MNIAIYTDGACSGNPGPGGWGYVVVNQETNEEIIKESGGESYTTNNRMELTAVINALKKLQDFLKIGNIQEYTVSVHTDSQYVQNGISSWIVKWKKNNWRTSTKSPVKNKELWQELDAISLQLKPVWHWVKGHSGNKFNELCDKMAVFAIPK